MSQSTDSLSPQCTISCLCVVLITVISVRHLQSILLSVYSEPVTLLIHLFLCIVISVFRATS